MHMHMHMYNKWWSSADVELNQHQHVIPTIHRQQLNPVVLYVTTSA